MYMCFGHVFLVLKTGKELGCFHIIFAQILTAHNFRLTRITASILIYANALGYFLSIKHDINLFMLLYMRRGV